MKNETHEKTMRIIVRSMRIRESHVDPSRKRELEIIRRSAHVPILRQRLIRASSYVLESQIPRRGMYEAMMRIFSASVLSVVSFWKKSDGVEEASHAHESVSP